MPFLAIDIGNTRLKWALFPRAEPGAQPIAGGAEFLENIDKLADGDWARSPRPDRMSSPSRPPTFPPSLPTASSTRACA